jgi:adenylate cyclase
MDQSEEPSARRIELAQEPPLAVRALRIEPRLRRITRPDGAELLVEPRVMQVLVALLKAKGGVVSRDELLQSCWNGTVVGEDAIDRVIGRIRRLIEGFDGLKLETITKVGYRLLVDTGVAPASAPEPAGRKPAICVLPFLNIGDDPQQSYFSDGITEDVITDLSKVSALTVLARTTSFSLREVSEPVPELAGRLGVSHVLEGSVRKSGGQIRVNAQLIDGKTGAHLWAERYDRPLSDIFALQDELAAAIVAALRLRLLPEEKQAIGRRSVHSPEAYELYLLARRYYRNEEQFGDLRQLEAVERLCRRAVSLDPDYAQAWSLMAEVQSAMYSVHGVGAGGFEALDRALALDPQQAEPHALKARNLLRRHRFEEARAELDLALALDPESTLVHSMISQFFYVQRRFAEAIPHLERALTAGPTWSVEAGLLSCYRAVGDVEGLRRIAPKVLARAERALAHDYVSLSNMAAAVAALGYLGHWDRAKALLDRGLLIDPDNAAMRYNFACAMCVGLNDLDTAVDLLEPVFAGAAPDLLRHALVDPDLDALRDDPRFKAMVAEAAARLGVTIA